MPIMFNYIKGIAKIGKYSLVMGTASGVGFATYVGAKSNQMFGNIHSTLSKAFQSTQQHAYDFKDVVSDQFQTMAVSLQEDEDDFSNLVSNALSAWKLGVIETLKTEDELQDHADELELPLGSIIMKSNPHEQFNPFIKKLLHIQSILEKLNESGVDTHIHLPSIVVIGSQSSGKSSVLESLIGHEFLPKGNNMVTKRPLELTLVNSDAVYAEFDDMKDLGKMSNFNQVSRTLLALNNAISIDEIHCAKPIKLTIHSPYIPDLRLVDLPGYVRVSTIDQPLTLQQGIEDLCAQYIQEPNIILAVSAADVDLANSDALRVSKKVDPLGSRTLGVLTKLDKIEPQQASDLLNNKLFPLKLGYIGVVCPPGPTINPNSFPNQFVGFPHLRSRLVSILTDSMKQYSESTLAQVLNVLDTEKYSFNVNFHDTKITPHGYIDQLHDQIKAHVRHTVKNYNEQHVLQDIQQLLHKQLFQILESTYLTDKEINNIEPTDYWVNQLKKSTFLLTKSGIGRIASQTVHSHLRQLLGIHHLSSFEHHKELQDAVDMCIDTVIKERLNQSVDQIEHILKPWKTEHIGSNVDAIWEASRNEAIVALTFEYKQSLQQYNTIASTFGSWTFPKLKQKVIDQIPSELSHQEIQLIQQALYHQSRSDLLQLRIKHLQSKSCKGPLTPLYEKTSSWWSKEDPLALQQSLMIDESLNPMLRTKKQSVLCPEAFLFGLASQMATISAKYIWLDLVLETYTRLPLELEDVVFSKYRSISQQVVTENSGIRDQINAQERIRMLELAANELRKIIREKHEE